VISTNIVTDQTTDRDDAPDITVVIVNYNTGHMLDRLFSALAAAQGELRLQTIVIDNGSRDNSVEILRRQYPGVELIENHANVGFGRANNQALGHFRGRYLLLLNTDAFVRPDTLVKTISFMESNPHCGVLGVQLIGEDGSLQPSCRFFPTPWNVFIAANGLDRYFPGTQLVDDLRIDQTRISECDWVPGCYYLTRKPVIDQIGLFDPRFFLYCEEVDHCRRVHQAGWRVYFYPNTQVAHIGGESAKTDAALSGAGRQIAALQAESELLYFRKHYGLRGLAAWIILIACGSLLTKLKNAVRSETKKSAAQEKWTIVLSLLKPTRWATQPTR
jgi:N-acetylglucosaminyl-diphospho-decaprenol L-rhamnosyltransferase